jgi:hypothetical protein
MAISKKRLMERNLRTAMKEAERKAWDSLSRYKFVMFGYHAGTWINLNRLLPERERHRNPFHALVMLARTLK